MEDILQKLTQLMQSAALAFVIVIGTLFATVVIGTLIEVFYRGGNRERRRT